jgi:23S rRNA pseudouridine1911/1915/1917 synthase
MEMRYEFTIGEEDARRRLDAFLALRFGGISRMRLRQAVEQGEATVDGAVVVPGHRLRVGETVVVEMGELAPTAMTAEPIPLEILYEDAAVAVVNKPAGMLSHPVRQYKSGTLANALAYHFNAGTPPGAPAIRPGLAHRLDRATSGLMVVAKTDVALSRLTIDFQNRAVEKRYRALVWGAVAPDQGWVAAPIGRNPESRPRWWVRPEGRAAETRYRIERRGADFTLLELEPLTGRTNQLRIHCAWLGHPIAGDTEYGGAPEEGERELPPGLTLPDRLFLHASFLGFRHPGTREWMRFQSPLPVELEEFLRRREW